MQRLGKPLTEREINALGEYFRHNIARMAKVNPHKDQSGAEVEEETYALSQFLESIKDKEQWIRGEQINLFLKLRSFSLLGKAAPF